jgi:hypothetical protein
MLDPPSETIVPEAVAELVVILVTLSVLISDEEARSIYII